MSFGKKHRSSRSALARSAHAAVPSVIEGLERRVLLSTVVPNTTPLHTGLDSVIKTATDVVSEVNALHDKIFGVMDNLPLVGSALKNASGGASDALNSLSSTIQGDLNAMTGAVTGVTIQNAIFAALSGLNILPSSVHSASDIPITLKDTDGNAADAEEVDLNLDIQGNLFTATLNPNFDLGLPGLGLKVNGQIQAQVSYDIKLNIDANTTDGLYLDLSPNPDATLKLAITAPGLSAQGNLGFLQLNATDGTPSPSPTKFTQLVGTISADLSVGGDEKLKAGNIGSLISHSSLSAGAEADVHLHSILSFGGSAQFPSLQADLDLTWNLSSASLDSGGDSSSSFGSEPDVAFNNIQLDLGSFFSKFVTPIVSEIKTVLQPLQPLIDLLNTRMPVFSDIGFLESKFDTNHDGKVSLLEVIDFFNGGSTKFLDTVVAIDNFVNSIPSLSGDTLISLGAFDLGGASNANNADIRGLADLTGINLSSFNADNIASEMTSIGNSIGGSVGGQIGSFLGNLANSALGGAGGDDGGGLHFPILENPSSAFKILLGQNVDLFTFDTPTLNLNSQLDEFFSILGPLGVELKGNLDTNNTFVEAKAHLSMGYDTQGLKEFATTDHFNPADVGDLFDGFYLLDDPSKTFASLSLGASAFAAINVVVASAGVGGGLTGNITFDVNDPDNDGLGADGRLRPKEIASDLEMSPLCLFDISGKLTASLSAFIKVGFDTPFGFVGWADNFDLGSTTLADFSFGCSTMPANPPVLATVLGDGTLRLNMGPNAAARINGDVSDDDESFVLTPIATAGDGTETIQVAAFGYQQVYSGVTKIYGEGGQGNDSIILAPGIAVPAELWGDFNGNNNASGNDTLTASDGPSTMHGGGGNDQLTAGSGASSLFGDDGNDLMIGSPQADFMDGGSGDDAMYGNAGNDTMTGDAGNDYMDGGDGNDSLDGGDDNDHLIGGTGNDTETGGGGNDILEGNDGADSLMGGTGNDLLLGDNGSFVDIIDPNTGLHTFKIALAPGGGNDTMDGGDGNDSIFGQDGNDSITGGNDNDYIQGNAGNDNIDGGAGNDSIIGGQGNDSIVGGTGNDVMLGDDGDVSSTGIVTLANSATDGNDTMNGNDGNDNMFGQGGNDSLLGGAGDDTISGGDGNDKIVGDDGPNTLAGNDSLSGDAGDDIIIGDNGIVDGVTLFGGNGNDTIHGGSGNDLIYGQGGNDSITGDDGSDSLIGGQGNDTLDGGTGNDILLGDDGTIVGSTVTAPESATDGNDVMTGGDDNDSLLGQGGNDSMDGGNGNDSMVGGQGNDTMVGGTGVDIMLGDDGAIVGLTFTASESSTDGNDSMSGGDGNDTLLGQGGADFMDGGNDNDSMSGGSGNDSMLGGFGADSMTGDSGDDVMLGDQGSFLRGLGFPTPGTGDGPDTMTGNDGNDVMYGEGANDSMLGNAGNDFMDGGDGNDSMIGGQGNDTMSGDAGVDIMLGDDGTIATNATFTLANSATDGADSMSGGDGNDEMYGQGGNDVMFGNNDDDNMVGGQGADSMDGGSGNDAMLGDDGFIARSGKIYNTDGTFRTDGRCFTISFVGGGNDTMLGSDGHDTMYGQNGNDSMSGGTGDDDMIGGAGADTMDGGDGQDAMLGDDGTINTPINRIPCAIPETNSILRDIDPNNCCSTDGNDSMTGGTGADTMLGQGGNDYMDGNAGDDYMEGNAGNDTMLGEAGDDDMIGGSSNCWFWWFQANDGSDSMDGGDGNDVMLGDNGSITRPTDRTGTHYLRQTPGATPGSGVGLEDNAVIRCVSTFDGFFGFFGTCGNDTMTGGTGDDIMYGQTGNDSMSGNDGNDQMIGGQGNDWMDGGAGNDAMLGDDGIIVGSINSGKCQTTLSDSYDKLSAVINVKGTINWCVSQIGCNGGNDTMFGGLGDDVIHTGAGNDIALGDNGTVSSKGIVSLLAGGGNDAIFGDSGCDRMYGGDGSDHLYGGSGNDYMDGGTGADTIFGGSGYDTLIADTKDDRLIDTCGSHNTFIVPSGDNSAPTIIKNASSRVNDFLLDLAAADGSADPCGELGIGR